MSEEMFVIDLAQFSSYLNQLDRSELTRKGYIRDLIAFNRWYTNTNGEALQPQNLTPSDIREYRQYLIAVKREKPNTVNHKISALRSYSKWAKETGLIQSDPTNSVRAVGKQPLAPRWLDKREEYAVVREAERMIAAAGSEAARFLAVRDHAILITLLNTGLRVGELCALDIADIELSERKGSVIVRSGKGAKQRVLPLNAKVRDSINRWLELRGNLPGGLFLDRNGKRLTPSGVHRRLAELGNRAGVDLHAHIMRHTFAKRLVDAGVTLEKVAALLGHSDMNTTRIYITPGERDLEQAVEALE
ncbi:MAG: Site-specific recombinase XerD [Anaerolineae bacterium]|nr:MAG: Site-specific recombinase XerD [Anaerolineae bacterium]